MAHSFGIILGNRAVVLGALTLRDLLDIAVQAQETAVFDTVAEGGRHTGSWDV